MKHSLILLIATAVVLIGCSGATPTPVPTPTEAPKPTATLLPTATPVKPTATPVPPTATPTPVPPTPVPPTNTPMPTATNTRVVPTKPKATATNTALALRYRAPELVEPMGPRDSRSVGNDLVFVWLSVGALGANECYRVDVTFVNPNNNDLAPENYVWECNNSTDAGARVQPPFVLYRPTYSGRNYAGQLAYAILRDNAHSLKVRWTVTVVRDDGVGPDGIHHKTTPLSPPSATFEFRLDNP